MYAYLKSDLLVKGIKGRKWYFKANNYYRCWVTNNVIPILGLSKKKSLETVASSPSPPVGPLPFTTE